MHRSVAVTTGMIGFIAAVLTGVGEFVLHFDPAARFSNEFEFFQGIAADRTTMGHFVAVLGAPLYLIGTWHVYLMLRSASPRWAMIAFLVTAYGFAVGAVWIGSRASVSALVNAAPSADIVRMIALYELRYESLLQVIRIAVLILSVIFIWLVASGRSQYPRWMAALNPILLIIASFVVFAMAPGIGKYLMPIALNVAFAIFFITSTGIANRKGI